MRAAHLMMHAIIRQSAGNQQVIRIRDASGAPDEACNQPAISRQSAGNQDTKMRAAHMAASPCGQSISTLK